MSYTRVVPHTNAILRVALRSVTMLHKQTMIIWYGMTYFVSHNHYKTNHAVSRTVSQRANKICRESGNCILMLRDERNTTDEKFHRVGQA